MSKNNSTNKKVLANEKEKARKLFDEKEWDAYMHLIPMDQRVFNRCVDKCMGNDVDSVLFDLMDTYPEFLSGYYNLLKIRFGEIDI